MYDVCSATHGVHRETSCVAEHVQYRAVFGVRLKQLAVFALVNEESGLLTAQPVDMELQTVFYCYVVLVATVDE